MGFSSTMLFLLPSWEKLFDSYFGGLLASLLATVTDVTVEECGLKLSRELGSKNEEESEEVTWPSPRFSTFS